MSNNDINKNFPVFTEFKYPLNHSTNNSLIDGIGSNTPHKDIFFNFKPQINISNNFLNIPNLLMSDYKSPNKFSSISLKKKEELNDPLLFTNGYNSTNKKKFSEFDKEKINFNLYLGHILIYYLYALFFRFLML